MLDLGRKVAKPQSCYKNEHDGLLCAFAALCRGLSENATVFRGGVLFAAMRYLSSPPMQRYFTSRNSSMPYFEPSRPMPDSFIPPNGATSVEISPVLTPTMPYSSASATRHTRPMSRP